MSECRRIQREWAETSMAERLKRVRALRSLIAENCGDLARASADWRGRPAAEALVSEVIPLAECCRFLEGSAQKLLRPRKAGVRGRPIWLPGVTSEIRREPHGVVLIIAPGNYPLFLAGAQMLQALVAGNAVWWKPGEGGAEVSNLFQRLLWKAGFPIRLVTLLPESREAALAAVEAQPDKIVFTGSSLIGRQIARRAGELLIPHTLELSGNDGVVVCEDADLNLCARALAFGLRLNGGYTCLAPKRVFVPQSRLPELERLLIELLPSAGSFFQRDVNHPLSIAVNHAIQDGAQILSQSRSFFIVTNVPPRAPLLQQDFFGPLLSIAPVASEEEAVAGANDSEFALGAAVFSRDLDRARAIADRLKASIVTINDLIVPTADPRLPFGGNARSGYGVTRGAEGLLEMTRPKVVILNQTLARPAFDPLEPGDELFLRSYLDVTCRSGGSRVGGVVKLIKYLIQKVRQ